MTKLVKTKKRKKPTPGKLKKKAWELLSRCIRIEASDDSGYCSCVTCGLTRHYTELQAGHFIPKAQGNAIYFDERNINPQCYRCNINLGGNGPEYFTFMEQKYGREVIEDLRRLSNTTVKFTAQDYEEMIESYQSRLREVGV